jgi:acyl-CoA-binding protein
MKNIPFDSSVKSGSVRWKLYGLQKQILDGNNKQPMPPRENSLLTLKWESWSSFRGITKDDAMAMYIKEYESEKDLSTIADAAPPRVIPNLLKEGIVFEQKDVFEGWVLKTFIINDRIISDKADFLDPMPKRRPIYLKGCTVVRY